MNALSANELHPLSANELQFASIKLIFLIAMSTNPPRVPEPPRRYQQWPPAGAPPQQRTGAPPLWPQQASTPQSRASTPQPERHLHHDVPPPPSEHDCTSSHGSSPPSRYHDAPARVLQQLDMPVSQPVCSSTITKLKLYQIGRWNLRNSNTDYK